MNQAILNPWAPPYLNGFNNLSPENCQEEDGAYVWPVTGQFQTMSPGQILLGQSLVLEQEDEFVWRALQWSLSGETQPGFLYRVQDDQGNWISDGLILCYATPGSPANPFPQFPHVVYKRGQQIKFDVQNASSEEQGVQIVFRGGKRYWNSR